MTATPCTGPSSESLNSAGISGATTVRGIWGYHGDHAPHGEHFPRQAHHVPVVTTVIAAAEQISAAFDAIDPHTAERGLVTAETVLAARPTADAAARTRAMTPGSRSQLGRSWARTWRHHRPVSALAQRSRAISSGPTASRLARCQVPGGNA